MGVQQKLGIHDGITDAGSALKGCREHLIKFHDDVTQCLERDLPWILGAAGLPQPVFVAEFSDSAYLVAERFGSVAAAGILMMRSALRHEYPLRGGIGVGSFSHESSGVRTNHEGQIWSTASFLGSAAITAYQMERAEPLGFRIFVHPQIIDAPRELFASQVAIPIADTETVPGVSRELRYWRSTEAQEARARLVAFRDRQKLSARARQHYDVTIAAYERFATYADEIPFAPPALWLTR